MGGGISLIISQLVSAEDLQIPFMFPCFFVGGILALKDCEFKTAIRFAIPFLAVFVVLLLFLDSETYQLSKKSFVTSLWQIGLSGISLRIYLIALGLSGSLFFVAIFNTIFKELPNSHFVKVSAEIGRYTLGIYILQTFILEWFLAKHLNFDALNPWIFNLLVAPLISLLLLAACYFPLRLIKRNNILSFLFLGTSLNTHKKTAI